MTQDFWLSRWNENKIAFHQAEVNHYLTENFDRLGLAKDDRILVPLCGKSLDMMWLRDRGMHVVGAELSEIAVKAFFEENDLDAEVTRGDRFARYRGEGIEIFCGDFFDLRAEDVGEIKGVYDRAALIALPPEMRARYAPHLASLLPSEARMLLITIEYDQSTMNGPPFSVPASEVEELFGEHFTIEPILSVDVIKENERFRERGVPGMLGHVMMLAKRPARS